MSEKFTVEIISPSRLILKADSSEVTIPAYEGQMGILKDHVPLITFLRPGLILIKSEDEKIFFVEDGTVEFNNNVLLILTSTAKILNELNKVEIDEMIRRSNELLENDKVTDKEKYLLHYKIRTLQEINI
tara:strand:+ start:696 stop:1085 length:390 start_codon:yes stop_codon:yes gene_type:complete